MQFPNGVNKSNLIKLGVLGAAYYLIKGKKTSASTKNTTTNPTAIADNTSDSTEKKNEKLSPFQLGKELANKVLNKKF